MRTSFRNGFYAGLLGAFIIGLWLARLWGAENQVRLHSEHLLQKVEARDWSGLGEFLATDYHDDWGNDRTQLPLRLRLVARLISSLTITPSETHVDMGVPKAIWRARLHVEGRGEAGAEINAQVNSLTKPFELCWRRQSRRPWDWKLVEVKNPELHLSGGDF